MDNYTNSIAILYPQQTEAESDHIWVSEFKRYLEASFQQLSDKRMHIHVKNIHHDSSALELNQKHAIFICLVSPEYLENTDFTGMLEALYEMQKDEPQNRIFHLIKFPPQTDNLPEWLQYKPQYVFYEKKLNSRRYVEIDFSKTLADNHVVWHKLTDLVYDTHETISKLSADDNLTETLSKAVFVAETTPDQEENRSKIVRELKQHGFEVYPRHTFPVRSKEINPILDVILDKCMISVHMFGGLYGSYLKDARYSVTDYINRSVREYIKSNDLTSRKFKRIIWMPPYLKVSDQRQDLFLGRLKREENDPYTEVIQSPLEELKTLLFRQINNFTDSSLDVFENEPTVYIIHDPITDPNMEDYITYFKQKSIKVVTLNFENERSVISQHISNLKLCDSVLIIDNNNRNWLDAKLRDMVKIKGYGRTKPFAFKTVLTENDYDETLDETVTKDVVFINNQKTLASALEPLLNKMEKNHA